MLERLSFLKDMQAEIERSEKSFRSNMPRRYVLPERACRMIPYDGCLGCEESNELMKKLILEIYQCGANLGNANGLLLRNGKDGWKQYLFVDIDVKAANDTESPEILYIPEGEYLCKTVEHSSIHKVWDWCLPCLKEEEQPELIIETELFMGNYAFSKPVLEQRCLLHHLRK